MITGPEEKVNKIRSFEIRLDIFYLNNRDTVFARAGNTKCIFFVLLFQVL